MEQKKILTYDRYLGTEGVIIYIKMYLFKKINSEIGVRKVFRGFHNKINIVNFV